MREERPGDAISLHDEFGRVRADQERRHRRGARPSLSKRRLAIVSVLLIFLIATAAVIGPAVYHGTKAYQNVFVDSAPHQNPRLVAVVNAQGTPVIATVTATAAPPIPEWDGKDRLTLLLLGIDRRKDEPARSDTMILINVDPVTKRAAMLSIPRDLKVIIPGYGVHKINAAYAFGDADKVPGGGPALAKRTVEANFGIRVDYFAEVDFRGFIKIVDTIGGLTLDVPYPIKDDAYPASGNNYMRIYFPAGWQHMDGTRVLEYARTRHDDGDGRRSVRQQQVLLALRQQAVNLNLLPKAAQILADVGDSVRTDLQPTQALQLARLASEFAPGAITQYSLNPAITDENVPGQPYYIIANWDAVGRILSDFAGAKVTPPMSALANPRHDLPIRVENGTTRPGLAARVAAVLVANGFTNVTTVALADAGPHPTTSLTAPTNDLTTGYLVAGLVGVDVGAINVGETAATPTAVAAMTPPGTPPPASPFASPPASPIDPTPAGQPSAATAGAPIVILLGDDARDPAFFTAEPFKDDIVPTPGPGGKPRPAPAARSGMSAQPAAPATGADLAGGSTGDAGTTGGQPSSSATGGEVGGGAPGDATSGGTTTDGGIGQGAGAPTVRPGG